MYVFLFSLLPARMQDALGSYYSANLFAASLPLGGLAVFLIFCCIYYRGEKESSQVDFDTTEA